MARDAIRPGKLAKKPLQPGSASLDIRITLGIRTFEIGVRHEPRTAMTGTND